MIQYKKELENKAANVLSRLLPVFEFGLLSVLGELNPSVFIVQVAENESLNSILLSMINGQQAPANIRYNGRFCVVTVVWFF